MHFVARTSPRSFKEEASAFLRQQGLQGFDIVFDSLQGSYFQPGWFTMSKARLSVSERDAYPCSFPDIQNAQY
eukprot:1158332-Pelagomonas_calceolata.AAC.1